MLVFTEVITLSDAMLLIIIQPQFHDPKWYQYFPCLTLNIKRETLALSQK